MPVKTETKSGIWKNIGRWFLELLIVFAGVYAAYSLTGYQQEEKEQQQKVQLLKSILEDITYLAKSGREQINLNQLQNYIKAIEEKQVSLVWTPSKIPYRPDVWEAALQSGGLSLIELPVLMRLSNFYGGMKDLIEHMHQTDEYMREILLPNIEKGNAEFYQTDGKLREKYKWYLHSLKETRTTAIGLLSEADSLAVILNKTIDKSESN